MSTRVARAAGRGHGRGRAYLLGMVDVLIDVHIRTLALLGVEHLPEEGEPVEQEAAVGRGHGDDGRGQVIGALRVHVGLGVGVHGVVAEPVAHEVAVLVAAAGEAVLGVDLDEVVAVEDGAGAVEHFVAQEVLVYVRVEEAAHLELVGGGAWPGAGLGDDGAIIHHAHRGANGDAHGGHVGHVDVVHRGTAAGEAAGRRSGSRGRRLAAKTAGDSRPCAEGWSGKAREMRDQPPRTESWQAERLNPGCGRVRGVGGGERSIVRAASVDRWLAAAARDGRDRARIFIFFGGGEPGAKSGSLLGQQARPRSGGVRARKGEEKWDALRQRRRGLGVHHVVSHGVSSAGVG